MQFSDEDLVAYLLGDAPQALQRAIELQLSSDPDLMDRITHFRILLGQIDSVGGVYEPPSGLVENTLARIDEVEAAAPPPRPAPVRSFDAPQPSTSLLDSTVLTLCLAVMCCLALPMLVRVRFESRKAQCAEHLRATGQDLMRYALDNPAGRFPFVPPRGRDAFAGIYAVHLRDSGNPILPGQLQCASLLGSEAGELPVQLRAIPTFSELHEVALRELHLWQRAIGGHYAYNLGVSEGGEVCAPKYAGRSHFAILADAPVIVGEREEFVAHGGEGINILFEDGRVSFVSTASLQPPQVLLRGVADNPFRNQLGEHEVGVHRHDAVLGPSHFPPLAQ